MGRRLLNRWEALPPRRQIQLGVPIAFVALVLIHAAFFPHLTLGRVLGYALMEAVPLALVFTYATQVELVRRAQRDEAMEPGADASAQAPGAAGIDMPAGIDPALPEDDAPNSGAGHADG